MCGGGGEFALYQDGRLTSCLGLQSVDNFGAAQSHITPGLTFRTDYKIPHFNLEYGGEIFFRNIDTHFQTKTRHNDDKNNI